MFLTIDCCNIQHRDEEQNSLESFKSQSVDFTKRLKQTPVVTLANTYIHIHCVNVHVYAYIYTNLKITLLAEGNRDIW